MASPHDYKVGLCVLQRVFLVDHDIEMRPTLPNVMKLQAWLGLCSVRRCAESHVRRQARVHSAKAFMAQRVVAIYKVSQ